MRSIARWLRLHERISRVPDVRGFTRATNLRWHQRNHEGVDFAVVVVKDRATRRLVCEPRDGSFNLVRGEWHRSKPYAGGVKDRIADRGGYQRCSRLAGTPRHLVRTIDEVHDDFWNLRKLQDRVARPINARHPRSIEK